MENSPVFSIKYTYIPLSETVISLAAIMLVKGRPMHAEHLLQKSKLLMFLYVDWLGACMLHKCVLYAAIKLIISGSYVSPYQKILVHYYTPSFKNDTEVLRQYSPVKI